MPKSKFDVTDITSGKEPISDSKYFTKEMTFEDSFGSSNYSLALMQLMMQQMQQNFAMMMQQQQFQMAAPSFEPPPLQRPHRRLDLEVERAKIRDRLERERQAKREDRRSLASTLRTSVSLLEKDPSVVSGESLIQPMQQGTKK